MYLALILPAVEAKFIPPSERRAARMWKRFSRFFDDSKRWPVATFSPHQLFEEFVLVQCRVHQIDPELPEIQRALRDPSYLDDDDGSKLIELLRELDPKRGLFVRSDYSIYMPERLSRTPILCVWTVARHAIKQLDDRLHKIVVDSIGTHLYDERANRLFTFGMGAIDPDRLGIGRFRERNAAAIIREFTEQVIDWEGGRNGESEGRVVNSVTVERESHSGSWKRHMFGYAPARRF